MSSTDPKHQPIELEIPDGVDSAKQAVELLRAWIGDGSLLVALNSDAFGDRFHDWGRLLAQLGHHVARAAAIQGLMSEHEALQAIRDGFEAMHPRHETTMSGKLRGRVTH